MPIARYRLRCALTARLAAASAGSAHAQGYPEIACWATILKAAGVTLN